jgi:hypothetical protein
MPIQCDGLLRLLALATKIHKHKYSSIVKIAYILLILKHQIG